MGTLKSTFPLNRWMKKSEYCTLSSPLFLPVALFIFLTSGLCGGLCLERFHEHDPGLPDITGPQGYDYVTGLHHALQIGGYLACLRHERNILVAVSLYALVKRLSGEAFDLLFTSGVYFRQYELFRVVEGREELVEQVPCPRIPVRLEHYDDPVDPAFLGGL